MQRKPTSAQQLTTHKGAAAPLDYEFECDELRQQALTHRSASFKHNERLEFLGDALIGFLIAEDLYNRFPAADEGQLTRTRALLVNKASLAGIARSVNLGEHVVLGEGELKSGGWRRDSILANTLEAVIGAIYLDAGLDACRTVVNRWFAEALAEADPEKASKDPKTRLQEYVQARGAALPRYETTIISGPSHAQIFTVACHSEFLEQPAVAQGHSRRKAEQAAAISALQRLEDL